MFQSRFVCRFLMCSRHLSSRAGLPGKTESLVTENAVNRKYGASKELSVSASFRAQKRFRQVNTSNVFQDLFTKDEEHKEESVKPTSKKYISIDNQISLAETVEELLTVLSRYNLKVSHALNIISTLSDWTLKKKIKFSDFENDARFRKLCHLLGQENRGSDVATVLEITGYNNASNMVEGMSLLQVVQILKSLAHKGKRSLPLLRALCCHIGKSTERLGVKQSADVLYAVTVLNFPDEVLLAKVANDVLAELPETEKSSVVGSILKSLGILRYKHTELLDGLSSWISTNWGKCRSQDQVTLLLTLATACHVPAEDNSCLWELKEEDVTSPLAWLDVVWSFAILGKCTAPQIASVLGEQFHNKLNSSLEEMSVAAQLKLLNLNAVAKFSIPQYSGPLLQEGKLLTNVEMCHSKEKCFLVNSVLDTLSNLLSSDTFLKPGRNTGAGFLIDGECIVDSKCNPIPVGKTSSTNSHRIAILVWDYHDMCRGISSPTGVNRLAVQLLNKQGYQVLSVPFTEFSPQEKLIQRVQYLEQKLKSLVQSHKT